MNRASLKQAVQDTRKYSWAFALMAVGLFMTLPAGVQASPSVSVNAWLGATAPADPIEITINAVASDPSGITKVDFYQNGNLLGTSNSAPYTFKWMNVAAGTYTLMATATSVSSGIASASVTIPTSGWLRIMALGDSVTQGISNQNSFRRNLWHELRNNSYLADFVGTWDTNCSGAAPPNPDFDQNNQGQCGVKASDVVSTVTGYATTAQPNMVVIDLGTNDLAAGQTTSQITTSLGTIIDDLRAVNPNVSIILAQITPTTSSYGGSIAALNSAIVTLASQKNTAQSPVKTVDLYTGMDLVTEFVDGLHPNNLGEQIVADRIYTGIASLLTTGSAPLVTSTGFVNTIVGTGINYQITATNSPASFGASSLPTGMSVNTATGMVTGATGTTGTYTPTVTATNASGTGSKVITITVSAPGTYNVNALYTSGTAPANGGADTFSDAYNSSLVGSTIAYNGSTFTMGPANSPDAYSNETVNVTSGTYSTLNMLGTSVGGAVANQTIIVHYTDGTTSTYTQSFSDWKTSQGNAGETIAKATANTIVSSGQATGGGANIYGYTFALSAKPVQSVTLPATRQVIVFGFQLSGGTSPVITSALTATGTVGSAFSYQITATNSPTSYGASPLPAGVSVITATGVISGTPSAAGTTNTTISATNASGSGSATLAITINASGTTPYDVNAIYTSGTTFATGGLDSFGTAYLSSELGASTTFNGSTFTFGAANAVDAWSNVTVNLPAGTYTTLNMVGTASGGIAHAQTFVVHYTDSTTQSFTANMSDWTTAMPLTGENKIVTMAHRAKSDGTLVTANVYLSGYTLTLNGKSVLSITLPSARGVVMLGFAAVTSGAAPVITSALTASGTVGTAFSYTITATNSPTSYNATPLPAGLSVNTGTGAITGTPTVQGIYSITISATNAAGTGTATLVLTIGSPATAFNVNAIYTSGATFPSNGGLDSFGTAYLSSQLGTSATYNTSTFTFGAANAADGWANATVNLAPGTYTSLDMVGTSSGGIASSQTFTVNYTDGTNQPFTISMKDWSSTTTFAGETKVVTMANAAKSDGTSPAGNHVLHGYTLTLNGHSVKSITLPAARGVVILGFKGH